MPDNDFFTDVQNEQARAKVGIFGGAGTGKTTTLALLAIGVSKTFHGGAPVAMMDTENGSSFLKPIFDAEGIRLLVRKSGAFADMVVSLRAAQQMGCCAFVMDSVTHTWRELVDAYCDAKLKFLREVKHIQRSSYAPQFEDWKDLKKEWGVWTREFLNSSIHVFVAGRGGYEYEYETNENTGKRELIKGDTKMKAEGEFGYEPNLLIEMETEREGSRDGHGGKFIHIANVLKDRNRSLNGQSFHFRDLNVYKAGDWQAVYKPFESHFQFLNISGKQNAISTATSEAMFDEVGDGEAAQRARARKIALEEIEALMGTVLWPGTTIEAKQTKLAVLDTLFGVRSWTAIEGMQLTRIEEGLFTLQGYEALNPKPEGQEAVVKTIQGLLEKVKATPGVPVREKPQSPAQEPPKAQEIGVGILEKATQGTTRGKGTTKYLSCIVGGFEMKSWDNCAVPGSNRLLWDLIQESVGKHCHFVIEASKGNPAYYNIRGALQIGNHKWEADGTPVLEREQVKVDDSDLPDGMFEKVPNPFDQKETPNG